ncbi:hypothetical protein GLYMA_02G140400v4 [Glycine max]|uniref:Uncharacterized protein n=2 Tax=Glycine subgen. Soja TaxID=1462606 RepID=K7K8A9_SOYBN|nr:hypothetical protein JHK87_003958 [Glycine soja]KAG5063077.1 hypothetical protein JHK85_004260 [Glycine max]KAH1060265.1 hypothetical protein GYH30_003973 [Glycine max]KRH71309.1 hypothetical protein GLYMA_02G140400v4 [Glycine max]RZC24915.1 hypothetical protein D0Y65_003882 [Glycine soja]
MCWFGLLINSCGVFFFSFLDLNNILSLFLLVFCWGTISSVCSRIITSLSR